MSDPLELECKLQSSGRQDKLSATLPSPDPTLTILNNLYHQYISLKHACLLKHAPQRNKTASPHPSPTPDSLLFSISTLISLVNWKGRSQRRKADVKVSSSRESRGMP